MNGRTLAIDTREGKKVSVQMADPATVLAVKRADRGSISPGAFVGIAAEPDAQGKLQAQEVLVFPENMRGTGEGQYGWDLTPKSNMTNGTVKAAKQGGGEQYLELTYKDASANIAVPPRRAGGDARPGRMVGPQIRREGVPRRDQEAGRRVHGLAHHRGQERGRAADVAATPVPAGGR